MIGVIYDPGFDALGYSELVVENLPGYVHLYTNDLTPDTNSVLGDFVECNDPTYEVNTLQYLNNATWNINPIGLSQVNNIYGWYVTDQTNSVLWAAGRFDNAPLVSGVDGTNFNFNLTFSCAADTTTNGVFTPDGLTLFATTFGQFPTLAVRLFTNNVTFSSTTTLNDLSECADSNYSWTTVGFYNIEYGPPVQVTFNASFNLAGANTIYGYMVTDVNKTKLYWGETFSYGPVQISSLGGEFIVGPNIQLS